MSKILLELSMDSDSDRELDDTDISSSDAKVESSLICVLLSHQVCSESVDRHTHSDHFCATTCYLVKSSGQPQARGTASLRQQCPDRVNISAPCW